MDTGHPATSAAPAAQLRTAARRDHFDALFAGAATGLAQCALDGSFVRLNRAGTDLLDGTGIDPDRGGLLDLVAFLPADDDTARAWQSDLAAVAGDPRRVARLHVSLAPAQAPPRFVEVTVTRVGLAGDEVLLARLDDATGRRLDAQRLVYLATHDAVTGLPNRELVQQRLLAALARSAANGLPVGVLRLDLDPAEKGDAVLAVVGSRLADVLRAADTAGRLGGEEFLVVAADVPDHGALAEVRRRIEAALGEQVEVDGVSITPEVCVGAVLSRPGEQPTSLLRRAEAARYAARRARRRLAGRIPATRTEQAPMAEPAAVAEHR